MAKMNWIDLFNIGNVMLMRGQDIQLSHSGWNEIGEFDDLAGIVSLEPNSELTSPRAGPKHVSNSGILRESKEMHGGTMHTSVAATSRIEAHQPELSLQRCHKYTIAKDCFTEIVLLTIIAYFCVSTE